MAAAPIALILNFTGDTYHWGCFGTATEICRSLQDRGYALQTCGVEITHAFRPSPEKPEELHDLAFRKRVFEALPALKTAMKKADLVVVNGEGTLHGLGPAARNLLLFSSLAKRFFKKPVHLINHSFYPADGRSAAPQADDFYLAAVRELDRVVAREIYSHEILCRLGVDAVLGFDCLPRFMRRQNALPAVPGTASDRLAAPLLVSGGVNMSQPSAQRIAASVAASRNPGQEIRFLIGAKANPAREDALIFEWMRQQVPDLKLATAHNLQQWTQAIDGAACLISGRFHHTIAAVTLGTPVVTFPSNTPKIEAISEMLWLDPPVSYEDAALEDRIARGIERARQGGDDEHTLRRRDKMLALAEENFKDL